MSKFTQEITPYATETKVHADVFNVVVKYLLENTKYNKETIEAAVKDLMYKIDNLDVLTREETIRLIESGLKNATGPKGDKGDRGYGIKKIEKVNTTGLIDTYSILYENGATSTFYIRNGRDGINGKDGVTNWGDMTTAEKAELIAKLNVPEFFKLLTLNHNLNCYPQVSLLTFTGGAGMGGAGEVPCGGSALSSEDVKCKYTDKNNVDIEVNAKYLDSGRLSLSTNDENSYLVCFDNKNLAMLLILRR